MRSFAYKDCTLLPYESVFNKKNQMNRIIIALYCSCAVEHEAIRITDGGGERGGRVQSWKFSSSRNHSLPPTRNRSTSNKDDGQSAFGECTQHVLYVFF